MDQNPTPFPGKAQLLRSRTIRKISEASRTNTKEEPPNPRQKRVFGTARNPNILPAKAVTGNRLTKPASGIVQKAKKPSQDTQVPNKISRVNPILPTGKVKKTPEETKEAKPRKKSVCFEENVVGKKNNEKVSPEGIVSGVLQTPVKSIFSSKAGILGSATPYYSAERCSKCRFDKLETSSYWIAQIRLAESVGKHFVSAAFFRLAIESNAEPIRNLRVELKKYLARHEHLAAGKEWREVTVSYGLSKEESSAETATQLEQGVDAGPDDETSKKVEKDEASDMMTKLAEAFETSESSNLMQKEGIILPLLEPTGV